MAVTVSGHSDDLIEVDGDVREEFNIGGPREGGHLLAFSDGTVLQIRLTDKEVWRIVPVHRGAGDLDIAHAPGDTGDTDQATLSTPDPDDGPIEWVVLGTEIATRKRTGAT